MESFTVQVETAGSLHTVVAWVDDGDVSVSALRGWLMDRETLNVGEIETEEAHRKRGFASRLVLHAARVLRVSIIQASTNSPEGEALFASLRRNSTEFEVDVSV